MPGVDTEHEKKSLGTSKPAERRKSEGLDASMSKKTISGKAGRDKTPSGKLNKSSHKSHEDDDGNQRHAADKKKGHDSDAEEEAMVNMLLDFCVRLSILVLCALIRQAEFMAHALSKGVSSQSDYGWKKFSCRTALAHKEKPGFRNRSVSTCSLILRFFQLRHGAQIYRLCSRIMTKEF
jgi:hypothetical protein